MGDIAQDHVLTCVACGKQSSYQDARMAYEEAKERKKESILIPAEPTIGPSVVSWWHEPEPAYGYGGYRPRGRSAQGREIDKIFVPVAAYQFCTTGFGDRSIPLGVTFNIGLQLENSSYVFTNKDRHGFVNIMFQNAEGQWFQKSPAKDYDTNSAKWSVEIGDDPFKPQIPADVLNMALEGIYHAVNEREEESVTKSPMSGKSVRVRALGDADMAQIDLWHRYHEILDPLNAALHLPRGYQGSVSLTKDWEPVIIYYGRAPLRNITANPALQNVTPVYAGTVKQRNENAKYNSYAYSSSGIDRRVFPAGGGQPITPLQLSWHLERA